MKTAGFNPHIKGNEAKRFHAVLARVGKSVLLTLGIFTLSISTATFAASNVQGSINGHVLDDSGNPVSGASVTVISSDTGLERTVRTDADGEYHVTSLPVGAYSVLVDADDFSQRTLNINVNVGTSSSADVTMGGEATELASVTVTGGRISPMDLTSTESATILGELTYDKIPVGRSITEVALLAPGTTRGDSAFGDGNLASFGGATVGENVCYINGLNVTNFRNGLGCSTVPFEFYQEFQLKTGGFSAEFGRATGGVINAVTKSGSNEFEYGFNVFYEPWIDSLNTNSPNVYRPDTGNLYYDNQNDESTSLEANVYASGPIIRDRAFFYVLYNVRNLQADNYTDPSLEMLDENTDDSFWGVKLDFNFNSNHMIELTAFSDERDEVTEFYNYAGYDHPSGEAGDIARATTTLPNGTVVPINKTEQKGGMNYVARYTGWFTPDFNMSLMYGENEYDLTTTGGTLDVACPLIQDVRAAATVQNLGCWTASVPEYGVDTRQAFRIDGEWFIGNHQLNFGFDNETNTSEHEAFYSGGYYWLYTDADLIPDADDTADTEVARLRYINQIGNYETVTSAFYIEDTWSVTDTVTLRLGLRNEAFENKNAVGESFIDISSQIAPRLGVAWDALGDGSLKVYANYGRYYLPVANNTNVRLAGSETFTEAYFIYDTVDPATGLPVTFIDGNGNTFNFDPSQIIPDGTATNYNGAQPITNADGRLMYNLLADGTPPDTTSVVDQDIDPMYQDELIVGFQKLVGDGWSVGGRAIFRDLKSTLEDLTTDEAFATRFPNGFPSGASCGIGAFHYVLANPGQDITINWDCPTGTTESYTMTAEELAYPDSERYYNAVELLFERAFDGVWFLQGSYTWSQSYGNNEGFVRSDNGQDDAGLTTLYDFAGLLDMAHGPLPNDRTHAVKMFGAWQFADHWRVGANLMMQSGRPVNAFGVHPTDGFAQLYGAESFLYPRGSRGRTPFRTSLDLSLDYETTVGTTDMNFGVDVFNIFDSNVQVEVYESAETDAGAADPRYGLPTFFQPPRYVRLRAQFDF